MAHGKTSPNIKVDIQPEVSIFGIFPHLNYKPWYALAEFGDNALESFLDNRSALQKVDGRDAQLNLQIELESTGEGRLVVRDNAAGIAAEDYAKAFKPASPPRHTDAGLAEFGIGMKTAATWFGSRWSVRSGALGESVERTVTFDVDDIVKRRLKELPSTTRRKEPEAHFTEIIISPLHNPLRTKTQDKIQRHIESIYRVYLRRGDMKITFNGAPLRYVEPERLVAPFHRTPQARARTWEKDIEIELSDGVKVSGNVYILETGSTKNAGFALFRGDRLIQGSADETYRPARIFKASNSFIYQRLAGELKIEGLDVSHTKDGFRWGQYEDEFLEAVELELKAPPLNMLEQAEKFRKMPKRADLQKDAEDALESTALDLERHWRDVLEDHARNADRDAEAALPPASLPAAKAAAQRDVALEIDGVRWTIHLELSVDPAVSDWYGIYARPKPGKAKARDMGVRISLDHPFMMEFSTPDNDHIEPLVRVAIALALAETTAREAGMTDPGDVRLIVNDLLKKVIWTE